MPSPRSTLFPYTTLFRSFFAERPMAEIAGQLGVTESRVSQMRAEALILMREAMRSEERFSRNAEPEIYTLSLHDALPIFLRRATDGRDRRAARRDRVPCLADACRGSDPDARGDEIGRAVQQECRARDLHSFPTRRSSDLSSPSDRWPRSPGSSA